MKILIAGGGVAGLTLANALEQAGVDYVLLERRREVAPQVGASIGIVASGARILDQLGIWTSVEATSDIVRTFYARKGNRGEIINVDDSSALIAARTGYYNSWGERQTLLQTLHDSIKNPDKILTGKNIVSVVDAHDCVTATCEDGTSYEGDILVGCDGVNSQVRQKIWELAEGEHPVQVKQDRAALHADYRAVFGIAHNIPALASGDFDTVYSPGCVVLTIAADGGKVYWYIAERFPKPYPSGSIPSSYSQQETHDFLTKHSPMVIRPPSSPSSSDGVTISKLWSNSTFVRLAPIEEGTFNIWNHGRLVCAGDSVHKSTPNLGLGGNSAIESVAALANRIVALRSRTPKPTKKEIEEILADYADSRKPRANQAVKISDVMTKAHTLYSWADKLLVFHVLPRFSEFVPNFFVDLVVDSERLDFLPLPERSLRREVLAPFNPMMGSTKKESKIWRTVVGLPLLILAVVAFSVMDIRGRPVDAARAWRDSGTVVLPYGSSSGSGGGGGGGTVGEVGILRKFYGVEAVDDMVSLINMFFVPGMYGLSKECRRQMLSFITDGTNLLLIWTFESARRANGLNILQFPNLFTLLGQLLGIGVLSPIWCFLHYLLSPIENFAARDQRLTRTRWSFASLPAILLAYLVPFYGLILWPALETRQELLYIWQLYPVYLAIGLWIGSRFFKDTEKQDRLTNTEKDVPVITWYIGASSLLGAVWWICTTWAGSGITENFIPTGIPSKGFIGGIFTFEEFVAQFLRWDEVFGFGSHFLWMAYLFWDLRAAGMLEEGWLKVVTLMLVSVPVIGPGATLGLAWLFREHILATRTHKGALTLEKVKRL